VNALTAMSVTELRDHVEVDAAGVRAEAERRRQLDPADLAERAGLQWALGVAERELGRLDASANELRVGIELAEAGGDRQLGAGLKMSLAVVVSRLGDLDGALDLLDTAEPVLRGAERARARMNRGLVLYWRGDFAKAITTLDGACRALKRHGDRTGEVRTRINLGAVLGQVRDFRAAERHLQEAIAVATGLGQSLIVANAHHNLGFLAMLQRDLPRAITEFEAAEHGYVAGAAGSYLPQVHANHAQVLADAGLFDDAETLAHKALEMFESDGHEIEMAGALVTLAEVRLAQRDAAGARAAADEAATWYRKQGRDGWVAITTSLALRAAARDEPRPGGLAEQLEDVARRLDTAGLETEAARSRLVAALVRAESAAEAPSEPVTLATRRRVLRGPLADRIVLAHVDAVAAQRRGDASEARRAISRGLEAAMSNQARLGSIETRAHAAVHGNALTEIGARMAIADRRPRELLSRIEATRVMAALGPSIRPPADPALARLLVELRGTEQKLADPTLSGDQRDEAESVRAQLERDIRRRSRTARGDSSARIGLQRELSSALALLDDRLLLAHARLDGRLYAVTVVGGRAQLHDLGAVDDVNERIEGVTFSLHRLNRLQGSDESRLAAAELLYAFADELAEIVLPPIVAESFDPVVIVPTAILHDVPWGLLPPLAGRAVSVNASVSAWGHAERTLRRRRGTLRDGIEAGFVAGPGLDFAEVEVGHLAGGYADPVVLTGERATVAACADLLARAELAHIACHGSFRRDNPMFSSLHVADGPLNVYDLEVLPRLPVVVVLSSCSVANAKVVQGGSLLGLANAFTTLGAASVIAPLTPISDASTVTVMDRLHRELIAGADPATALAAATMTHDVADPTAAAFIALGA
jgi:tetratricopeptide (TPR) repeat protein